MSDLETRLSQATDELRADVARIEPPPFEPTSRLAPMLAAAAVAIAIGIFAVFAMMSSDNRAIETIFTEPGVGEVDDEIVDPELTAIDKTIGQLVNTPVEATPEAAAAPVPDEISPVAGALPVAGQPQLIGAVSATEPGGTVMPVDGVGAWNADESMMLLYRRGAEGSSHVVVDASTGADVAILDISPPDIEQVYWSPTERSVLYFADNADLIAYDLASGESTTLHTFEGCAEVTAGTSAVSPSSGGDFGFVCLADDGPAELVAFNINTQREARRTASVPDAPQPSPSGEYFVAWNDDGSASVLDPNLADTGVVLKLDDNHFVFVVDGQGREAVAAALYNGDAVGTLVVLPLENGEPQVIIGPDAGDEYPPSGTRLSAVGSSTKLAVSIAGPASTGSALAGRLLAVDLAQPSGSEVAVLGEHGSIGAFEYWSTAFLAISPSGRFVASSSDSGGGAVNTEVLRIPD